MQHSSQLYFYAFSHSIARRALAAPSSMGEPSWQETLRIRLVERNARESAYSPIIEQCTSMLFSVMSPHAGYALS